MPNIEKIKPKRSKKSPEIVKVGLNIPHIICNHVVGKEHTVKHRIVAGIFLMFVGVGCAQLGAITTIVVLHMSLDAFGYMLHGFGTIPFIEYFTSKVRREETQFEEFIEEDAEQKQKIEL